MTRRAEARRVASRSATCRWRCARPAATLLELLIVLAVMALVASVAMLSLRVERGPRSDPRMLLADARRRAVRDGRPATIVARIEGRLAMATALPDGRVVADSAFGVNGLTGQPHARQRGIAR